MPANVVGGLALRKPARNCRPCVRSVTQVPLAWTNSPAPIIAACPTRLTRSRRPRALTRSTQNPVSGLWNVTRSTSPAKTSVPDLGSVPRAMPFSDTEPPLPRPPQMGSREIGNETVPARTKSAGNHTTRMRSAPTADRGAMAGQGSPHGRCEHHLQIGFGHRQGCAARGAEDAGDQRLLARRQLLHLLLDRADRNQPMHEHGALLADARCARPVA